MIFTGALFLRVLLGCIALVLGYLYLGIISVCFLCFISLLLVFLLEMKGG